SPIEEQAYRNIRNIWDAAPHAVEGPTGSVHEQMVMVDGAPVSMYSRLTETGPEFRAFEDRSYNRQPPLAFDPARAAIDFMRNGQALV
ncbi:hypothetical protein ABTN15_19565, partial [Acinetobacter baumannii]